MFLSKKVKRGPDSKNGFRKHYLLCPKLLHLTMKTTKLVKTFPVQLKRSIDYVSFQEKEVIFLCLVISESCNPCTYSECRSYYKQKHVCLQDNIKIYVQALLTILLCARTYKPKYSHLNYFHLQNGNQAMRQKGC